MATLTATRKLRPPSTADVMAIMATHQMYRRQYSEKHKLAEQLKGEDRELTLEEARLIMQFGGELMSDETFVTRLRDIVPANFAVVTTEDVAKIYNLRVDYELLPPIKGGSKPDYSVASVRLQVQANMNNPVNGIRPLSLQEQEEIFGEDVSRRAHYFKLIDVLQHPLGRWPEQRRQKPKPPAKRGRPTAREKLARLYQR